MQHVGGRRICQGAFAFFSILLGFAALSSFALGSDRGAAWCHDGNEWLGYAQDVPGSASQDAFTDCLILAAERGDGFALSGQLVDDGALIDLGPTTLLWRYNLLDSAYLRINAFGDRVTISDDCAPVYEVRLDTIGISVGAARCFSQERILETDQRVTEPDFTLYALDRAIVIDAEQGWYHAGYDNTGDGGDPTPRTELYLTTVGRGIWTVMGQYLSSSNRLALGPGPIAGADGQSQADRAQEWLEHVNRFLLPDYVEDVHTAWLPDWEAYWYHINELLRLMAYDLYGERARAFILFVDGEGSHAMIPEDYRILRATQSDTFASVLIAYVLEIADRETTYGPGLVATMIDVWKRYIPHFDAVEAQRIAYDNYVLTGEAISFEPPSDTTHMVRQRLFAHLPSSPSDEMVVAPDDLIRTVTLELARPYEYPNQVELISADDFADSQCWVREESTVDGATQLRYYYIQGVLTSERVGGYQWNGVYRQTNYVYDDSDSIIGANIVLRGTPSQVGRVLLEVTTRCPGGEAQEPRSLGYVEIIVEDPQELVGAGR